MKNKILTIKTRAGNYKIEVMKIEQKGVPFNKLKIPRGWRIPDLIEVPFIVNANCEEWGYPYNDFYFKQPFSINGTRVARLCVGSDWANLGCYGDPSNSGDGLGAIFVRNVK